MGARFYRQHMAAGGVDGVPAGSLYAANLLTDAGVQGSGKRYQGRQAFDEGRAAYAVNLQLASSASKPFPSRNNPISRILGTKYYSAGLGDDASAWDESAGRTDLAPVTTYTPTSEVMTSTGWANVPLNFTAPIAAPSAGGSSSQWSNVLNTASAKNIFAGIGTGLANLIGGKPSTTVIAAPASGMPSVGTMLLIGGALAVPLYLLMRKKK